MDAFRGAALALLAGVSAVAGCGGGGDCNALYTPAGLGIDVSAPDGSYRFVATVDGEEIATDVDVAWTLGSETFVCNPTEGWGECGRWGPRLRMEIMWMGSGHLRVVVGYSQTDTGPVTVGFQVYRTDEGSDALVSDYTFRPDYEVTEPDGNGCGEVETADAAITIPPP